METKKTCKYCGGELTKVNMPMESDWQVEYFMICLSDECPYYVRGWNWMEEQYKVKASYRYKYNPLNGDEGPMPIKSPSDLKDMVAND